MSDKEIYQNSSKKRTQKGYRGVFGDYCCIPGCQSAFYDVNCKKVQHCVINSCNLLKDIGVLPELIDLVKRKNS